MGRFGAIAGPILGGALIGLKLPLGQNFLIFAIPGVIAIAAVLLVARTKTVEESHAEPQPAESQASSIS
jgi:AAHS family benzoate transporter-like MFS transporter